MKNNVIEIAKSLLSLPSITPNDAGCQALLQAFLTPLGFTCETLTFGSVTNLWATYGTGKPLFVFAGHTDVVPTGPLADWISPPFEPEVRDGYLYGRGAVDMKGAIAAMMIATQQFIQTNPSFPGTIGFLITSDEEGPATDGTKKVIETLLDRGIDIDYCLIGEPSSIEKCGDQIRVGRRGSLHGKLCIHGKQGHVAHPQHAKNPIHMSALALHELSQTTWDEGNQDFPPTTFQISNIHSGTGAANVIPGHLESLFNFRFSTAVTVQDLQTRTETLLNDHALTYDLHWEIGAKPFISKQGKLTQAVQQAIQDITQRTTLPSTGGGTSDGRFIAPTGTEVVELGASNATAHHVNECISLSDLDILARIYERVLKILLF